MGASKLIKRLLYLILVLLVIGGIKAFDLYKKAYASNVKIEGGNEKLFYVQTGDTYQDVLEGLKSSGVLKNAKKFEWAAEKKNYANHVKPGRYLLKSGMSNNDLINMLRSGRQEPVMLTFNNIRTLDQLAERIAEQLEPSADDFAGIFRDTSVMSQLGFTKETLPCIFIPNTYEFYWNTSAESFVKRMHKEHESFWNKSRMRKAKKIGLTPNEVVTLASIVNEETKKDDEKDRVAGVYLNRMDIGMRLQADPTIIFALGDFSIRRVLNGDRNIDSPYNTYKYAGLPPGPICLPEISSVDAVLNREKHKYLYFCAKPDFSGYHNFAKTLKQHNRNAAAYRRELNKRKIYR